MNPNLSSNKFLLILSGITPLTKSLIYEANKKGIATIWITPRQIIESVSIEGKICNGNDPIIRWKFEEYTIDPSSILGVFNYIGSFPKNAFSKVKQEDREYLNYELISLLAYFLNNFSNVINAPRTGGISGVTDSLPYQWQYINGLKLEIKTPIFEISSGLNSKRGFILTDDFFDFLNWEPSKSLHENENKLFLKYKRPFGDPVIIWFIDELQLYFTPYGKELNPNSFSFQQIILIKKLLNQLKNKFELRLGQLLVFLNKKQITYGSIVPFVTYTAAPHRIKRIFIQELINSLVC